jgi:hypothetical protein
MKTQPSSNAMKSWTRYGGRIWLALLIAILIVPAFLPESYRRALDIAFDAFSVVLFVSIAALLGWGVIRDYKTIRPVGYLVIAAAMALAFVSLWNFVALYTAAGSTPVTVFGLRTSARPTFYWFPVLIVAVVAIGITKLRGMRKQSNTTLSSVPGDESTKTKA